MEGSGWKRYTLRSEAGDDMLFEKKDWHRFKIAKGAYSDLIFQGFMF